MNSNEGIRRIAVLLALALLPAACTTVRYQAEGDQTQQAELQPFDRAVRYRVEREFYRTPPNCAVVLPLKTKLKDSRAARTIENAIGRQLSTRIDRVIVPGARDRIVRRIAVDPATADGRRRLADSTRCDTVIEAETAGIETTYALVWAEARFGLTVRMLRARDGALLWRASHTAQRSEGSLPLSLFSIPIGAFQAGKFKNDQDVFPSMVEDVARRIMASLPDMRGMRDDQVTRRR